VKAAYTATEGAGNHCDGTRTAAAPADRRQ
jgi:hypothetical protein